MSLLSGVLQWKVWLSYSLHAVCTEVNECVGEVTLMLRYYGFNFIEVWKRANMWLNGTEEVVWRGIFDLVQSVVVEISVQILKQSAISPLNFASQTINYILSLDKLIRSLCIFPWFKKSQISKWLCRKIF